MSFLGEFASWAVRERGLLSWDDLPSILNSLNTSLVELTLAITYVTRWLLGEMREETPHVCRKSTFLPFSWLESVFP